MSEPLQGWTECLLGNCVTVLDRLRVPINSEQRNKRHGDVPYYGATGQVGWINDYLFDEELLLIGEDGAPFFDKTKPIAYIINSKSWVNNHAHVLRASFGITSNSYLKYFLDQFDFHGYVNGTTRLKLTQGSMNSIPVKLAPRNEQRRLVAKLEKLLSRVNAAQTRLASIPRILKRFRQSVLAEACSGDLTADWRIQHADIQSATNLLVEGSTTKKKKRAGRLWGAGVVPELSPDERESLPETWTWTKVKNLGTDPDETVQVGPMSMQSKAFRRNGVPVLNVGCVQWGEFDESKLNYLPDSDAAAFERYRVATDDILFTRSGTIGRCAIAGPKQNRYLMTFHLLRVRPTRYKCLPQYLQFVFQGATHIQRQTSEAAIGSTRAGFNTNLLANLDVPLPPMAEQQEIVRRVEALFKTADALEARYRKAKAHVDKLTQSILAKAFRGELVPQDPNDEPAPVLMERLHRSKNADEGNVKKQDRRGRRRTSHARS